MALAPHSFHLEQVIVLAVGFLKLGLVRLDRGKVIGKYKCVCVLWVVIAVGPLVARAQVTG